MRHDMDDLAGEVERLSRQIRPLLKDHPREIQAGVLADLLSLWLAGHWPPESREMFLAELLDLVRLLVPESEKEMFGPEGHPGGRLA